MGNEQPILDIPTDMSALKNEVIVQKGHRYGYDHALRNCGILFVEVETLEQYEQAFTERTVMAHFFNVWLRKNQPRRLGASRPQAWSALFQRRCCRCPADFQSMELHTNGV
jgi:hypothetical protein